jgi:ribosomal subunit interface protein
MNIRIQVIDNTISASLRQKLRRWVMKLDTFHSRILEANVILKKDNQSKDKGCMAEIRLVISGNDLFGKSSAKNFEDAIATVVESLRKRLRKMKSEKKAQRRN